MIFPPHLQVALLLQAALCLASTATNYSIDDQDPLFHYSGKWEYNTGNVNSAGGNLDKDGGHMLTYAAGSSATITYTFASVYFLACLWPYAVSTDYAIDGNPPIFVDMQDHSPPIPWNGNATVASEVLASWTSTANQEHTITVTIPPGGQNAVVDMFIFEVLDSSASQTSSSTGTAASSSGSSSGTTPSSSGSSSGITPSSSSSSSGTQGLSSTVARDLAISMGIVGAALIVLLIFLLWRFCIRRKDKNGGNMNPITPQYHSVPTIPENLAPLDDNSMSTRYDDATSRHRLGLEKNDLYRPSVILSYDHDRDSSLYSGPPSTLYTDQLPSSLPLAQETHQNLQRGISTLSMMSDSPPMYYPNPILDESVPVSSSSSSNGNTNEKSRKSPRIPTNTLFTAVAEPEGKLTSTAIPGRDEENVDDSVWDSGYPQPLRFVSIA